MLIMLMLRFRVLLFMNRLISMVMINLSIVNRKKWFMVLRFFLMMKLVMFMRLKVLVFMVKVVMMVVGE